MVRKATQTDRLQSKVLPWGIGHIWYQFQNWTGNEPESLAPGSFSAGKDLKGRCVVKPRLWFKPSLWLQPVPAAGDGAAEGTGTEGQEPHPGASTSSTAPWFYRRWVSPGGAATAVLRVVPDQLNCRVVLQIPKAFTELFETKVLGRNSGHVTYLSKCHLLPSAPPALDFHSLNYFLKSHTEDQIS